MDGDPVLRDEQLQDEIDLVGALVLAAAQVEGPLSEERIDEVLGVRRTGGNGGRPEPAPTR
jgi:hypothetical protein